MYNIFDFSEINANITNKDFKLIQQMTSWQSIACSKNTPMLQKLTFQKGMCNINWRIITN